MRVHECINHTNVACQWRIPPIKLSGEMLPHALQFTTAVVVVDTMAVASVAVAQCH